MIVVNRDPLMSGFTCWLHSGDGPREKEQRKCPCFGWDERRVGIISIINILSFLFFVFLLQVTIQWAVRYTYLGFVGIVRAGDTDLTVVGGRQDRGIKV